MGAIKETALDTEIYEKIVTEIESQNDKVISDSEAVKTAPDVVKNNLSIPDFVTADSDVIEMLKSLKVQVSDVAKTMREIKLNLEDTNTDATNSLN